MPRSSAVLAVALLASPAAADPPDFDTAVAPLLASHCLDCHRGAAAKGGLDLSRRAAVTGKDGAVVPGKLADSPLWERVAAGEMPPKKGLPAAEKAVLKAWIEGGARWGADPIDPFRITTTTRAGYDWWALKPVTGTRNQAAANPIDGFIAAKLRDKGLSPSPPADPRALLRRVTFDLTGLPPTPEEIDSFLRDPSPAAYAKVVDRLLASPHYGERWARHWLDVVRYGETDGFERNGPRANAWPYRDWVVRALNADLPYDRFVRLQLAGDVLHPADPDAVAATGFLVAGVHNTVLGTDAMRTVARQDELEDLVGAVGQTFLGLTLNCARCHDHKFDPISQADYYRFAALLAGVGHGERPLPDPAAAAALAKLTTRIETVRADLAAIEVPARKGLPGAALAPVAAWDFRTGPNDLVGSLHATPVGGAKRTEAGAELDGKTGFLRTAPLAAPLRAKTLEAWVRLDTLAQRGGGVMTVQTPDGAVFDTIAFGEQEPARWMAGSDFFRRTRSFAGPAEADADQHPVHVAIAVGPDGTVTGFRNGRQYGTPYKSNGPAAFEAGKAEVLFGLRHGPAGGNKHLAGAVVAARLYDRALTADETSASFAAGPGFVSDAAIDAALSPAARARRAGAKAELRDLTAEAAAVRARATAKVYANVSLPVGVTRLLARGDAASPREVVAPGGLPAVRTLPADMGLSPDAPDAARRKALAEWVASPKNPLAARVAVNRLWHHHFGTGLVETPSDFGFNGGRPSHPELLDWLAAEFVEHGWSLKRVHRLIVTSDAYRQQSLPRADALKLDADNRLLWRMKPRRLEGEAVRDAMLAAAGLLDRTVGGKGFSDYRMRNFNGTAYFDPVDSDDPAARRRSLYRFAPRGANPGLLDVLDCPDPASAAPRRSVTTTPLQALSLWNGAFALRTADAFAARLEKEAPGDAAKQVGRAWALAFGREPTEAERAPAERLVRSAGLPALCRALFNANEFLTVG